MHEMQVRTVAVRIIASSLCASVTSFAQSTPNTTRRETSVRTTTHDAARSSAVRAHPEFTVEAQTGLNAFTGGRGMATHVGPSWQARVGVRLFRVLSFGAVYTASYNAGRREIVGPDVGVLSNGGYLSASLVAPLPGPVHPYVGAGIGYGWNSIVGQGAKTSPLHDSSGAFVPMGIGFDVEASKHLSLGPQFVYQRSIGGGGGGSTSGGADVNQGDSWNLGVSIGLDL
jgi:hypothetical protein